MNKYIEAIKALDIAKVSEILQKDPKWLKWSEPTGKNALHFLCGVGPSNDVERGHTALDILKLLVNEGMDINSIHRIEDKNCGHFPATPLWYAYTRGRNERLYKYLLKKGADPRHCWWAIAWYDDTAAAELWLRHGAKIDKKPSLDELFLGSFAWKRFLFSSWLLEKAADVNAPGPGGLTALMLAVKRKDEDAIRLLIKYGADADRESDNGTSARKLAAAKGPKRLLDLFA